MKFEKMSEPIGEPTWWKFNGPPEYLHMGKDNLSDFVMALGEIAPDLPGSDSEGGYFDPSPPKTVRQSKMILTIDYYNRHDSPDGLYQMVFRDRINRWLTKFELLGTNDNDLPILGAVTGFYIESMGCKQPPGNFWDGVDSDTVALLNKTFDAQDDDVYGMQIAGDWPDYAKPARQNN